MGGILAEIDNEVWAKSDGTSLIRHVEDCLEVFSELKEALPALPEITHLQNFWELLFYAVYLHDIGKCHEEFQKVLTDKPNVWCHQRHEAYSVPFTDKLIISEEEKLLVKRAVLAHHRTFDSLIRLIKSKEDVALEWESVWKNKKNYHGKFHPENYVENLRYHLNGEYIRFMFTMLEKAYSKYFPNKSSLKFKTVNVQNQNHPFSEIARPTHSIEFMPDQETYWQNLLMWGAMKICDHYGSANIQDVFRLHGKNFIFLDRLQQNLRTDGKDFYSHQLECFEIAGNCILIAPTGSGKTEAALGWLRNQLLKRQGRAFYVLPYIASINAMHERLSQNFYVDDSYENSNLIGIGHGKLTQFFASLYEETTFTVSQNILKNQEIKRLRELHRKMIHPLKVVTPFQILKYCYGVKGFEMGFTELAGSYLIFDEIHAYDEITFAQILVSLKHLIRYLDCKVLIMTATLPSFMLKYLMDNLEVEKPIRANEQLLKNFNRHNVNLTDGDIFQQLGNIVDLLSEDKRIMVVCNTVKNAQEIFNKIKEYQWASDEEIVLLHSRFNAEDRSENEKFALNKKTKILVGTQAIEVSLDIDYDVLFSEPAPLDALLQRFGRVNRRLEKGICPVYVCRVGGEHDKFIYPAEIVANTLTVLDGIDVVRESELQKLLDKVYPDWLPKQKTNFEDTVTGFSRSLNSLQPYASHKENEEEFYEKFDGIQVLPVRFFNEYKRLIENYDFIEAEKFFVTISRGMYFKLKNEGLIDKKYFAVEKLNGKTETHFVISAKCKYFSDIGLTNERETESNFDEQFG